MQSTMRICLLFVAVLLSKTTSYLHLNPIRNLCFSASRSELLDKKFVSIIEYGRHLSILTATIQIKERNPVPNWKNVPVNFLRFIRSYLFKILMIVKYPFYRIFKKSPQVTLAPPTSYDNESTIASSVLDATVSHSSNDEVLTWKSFRSSVSNQLNAQEEQAAREVLELKFSMDEKAALPKTLISEISSPNVPLEATTILMAQTARNVTSNISNDMEADKDVVDAAISDREENYKENEERNTSVEINTPIITMDSDIDNNAIIAFNTLPSASRVADDLASQIIRPGEEEMTSTNQSVSQLYKEKLFQVESVSDNNDTANDTMSSKLKSTGTSGVISYFLTELAFWAISIPIIIGSYHTSTNEWLNVGNEDDRLKIASLSAGFLTVARLAVPVRFAIALALTPFIEKKMLPVLSDFTKKEKFNLKDVVESLISYEGTTDV